MCETQKIICVVTSCDSSVQRSQQACIAGPTGAGLQNKENPILGKTSNNSGAILICNILSRKKYSKNVDERGLAGGGFVVAYTSAMLCTDTFRLIKRSWHQITRH